MEVCHRDVKRERKKEGNRGENRGKVCTESESGDVGSTVADTHTERERETGVSQSCYRKSRNED